MSKAFTATAMSLMVDDNVLYPGVEWEAPVSNIIRDDFVLKDEYITTISLLKVHLTIEVECQDMI